MPSRPDGRAGWSEIRPTCLSLPSQALLDNAAAQVSIDQPTFGLSDSFAKLFVGNPFTAREAGKRLSLENAHPVAATPSIMLSDIALSSTLCNLVPARNGLLGDSIGPEPPIVHARFFPEHTRDLTRIDASLLPPSSFVDGTMNRAVVDSTERHCEFVAYFAAECARLHVA
jgi:hypothetical protein